MTDVYKICQDIFQTHYTNRRWSHNHPCTFQIQCLKTEIYPTLKNVYETTTGLQVGLT